MNNIPESERMALDFDGWLGSQEPVIKERVTRWLDIIPEAERPNLKQRLASQFIVAQSTGLQPEQVSENWEFERARFAADKGSEWFGGVNDDAQFSAKVKEEATFRRDERQIVFGPDDGKDAEAFKGSLVGRVQEAAFAGVPYPDALAAWQESATKGTGWREDRTGMHNDVGRAAYEKMAASVEKVKPIAEKAFNAIAKARGVWPHGEDPNVNDEPADASPVALFRGLTGEEKRLAFRMMRSYATPDAEKGADQAFAEAFGRGFENLWQAHNNSLGAPTVANINRKFAAGDEVFQVTKTVQQYAAGVADIDMEPEDSWGMRKRKLSEEEAVSWNLQVAEAKEDFKTMETLRRIGQSEMDPTIRPDDFWLKKVFVIPAESAALIAGMSTGPFGATATLIAAQEQYSNDEYMKLSDMGMEDGEARRLSQMTGVGQAALDLAGFKFLQGVPMFHRALKRLAFTGSTGARFATAAGGTFVAETLIEVGQDHIVPALTLDFLQSNPDYDPNWEQVQKDIWKALPDIALGMVLLSAAGGGYQTFNDSQMTRQLSNSRSSMTLAGYTEAQMDLIQQQPENERAALLSEFAPRKAPVGKEREALIERVVEEATKERAAYVEKLKAETGEVSDAMDYAVRVTRRQGTGWTVTTESGKSLVVDTAEAARRIRQDLGQAASQREADTLVAVVEDWHLADAEAQRETTFTGETATSDGTSITYKRDGKITREITDAATLETLRKEAEVMAQQTGHGAVNVIVNGSNQTFQTKVADAAAQVVQRLEIYRSASSVLTFLHESMESNWRAGIQGGTFDRAATQRAVAAIAGAFRVDGSNVETRAFNERVQRVADGTASDTELRETVSELAVADIIGRRKDGSKVKVGSISQAISDAIQRAANESDIAGLSKFQAFIRAAKTFFRGVLGTVNAIRKAKMKDGKLAEDWEAFMHKLTGTSEQTAYDAERVAELKAMAEVYVPPTAEEEAAGIAFSLSRAKPEDASNVIVAKDGTTVVGPTTFSISAYHGTPHKVDKFSTEKIGTGEGAQAYGWGLYFAESPKVAEEYRDRLTNSTVALDGVTASEFRMKTNNLIFSHASQYFADGAKTKAQLLAKVEAARQYERDRSNKFFPDSDYQEVVDAIKQAKEIALANEGNTYTVELDVEPDELLDWDKPLSDEMLERVGGAFTGRMGPHWEELADTIKGAFDATGATIYQLITKTYETGQVPDGVFGLGLSGGEFAKKASEDLAEAGIHGIRYLDGNSRDGGSGTYNYVIFDESKIKITAENDTTFSISPAQDAEYLLAVKRGDVAAQQRMVDAAAKAAGYDTEAYHGTWRGGFTEFKDDSHFSPDEKYATRFQSTSASSLGISGIKQSVNPMTYKVWMKLQNPLDTRKPKHRSIFNREFFGKYGNGTELSERGLPDWTDGIDLMEWIRETEQSFDGVMLDEGAEPDNDSIRLRPFSFVPLRSSQIKSADPVTRDESGKVIPLSQRFNAESNDIRFSISPSAHVELLQRQVDAQLKRDPDRRRKMAKAAGDKLQSLQFNYETDRVNARGVKTRALVEQRTPESLGREQRFREALRREELEDEVYGRNSEIFGNAEMASVWSGPIMSRIYRDSDPLHGRLMSKSAAIKSGRLNPKNDGDYDGVDGVPRVAFGGPTMPDQLAQELYEDHLLRDASVDTLWDAIKKEVASAAKWKKFLASANEELKAAKEQAKKEAAQWRTEQDELQSEDWNPKARLLRDMRALDAVISVLPPELRAKVGGFIKLAELSTDKARMDELERRMKKLGGLVEKHLQKESVEAIDRLIEKAEPSTGPGEKPKGKITVEGHRVFASVDAVRGMTTEQVDAERARLATAIEDRITKGEDVIDLLEQEQLLEMFGAIESKTAAEADAAATWLEQTYKSGKNAWRMIEEARLAEVAELKAQTIEAVGEASKSGTQEQKKNAAKLKAFVESASLQLLSFVQVLESVVGAGHPLVKRWGQAAREATNQRTDSILAANARFERAAREAFGGVSKLEMSRRLWAMSNDQRISLPVVEGGRSETVSVPIEKIRQFEDGSVNPADLGYSAEEAKDLIDQLNDPANSRKKKLSVERVTVGATKAARYTEAEIMALTMLAKQEQYLPNLAKHGYTAEVIEAAEASLSDSAKAIRAHLLAEYKDGYAPLARVFREMFGIDLPSVANYSPAAFMHAGETRDVDPFGGMVAEGGFRAGFLKSRKEHLAAPRIENAFQTYQGHVAQMEHWRAFAPLVRELRGVFASVDVKDSILSQRGAGLLNASQAWIAALEQNGLQQRVFMSALNPVFRYLTGKQATLTLAWKAGTLMKQSLAALSSATRLPSGVWLRGLSRVMSGKVDVAAILNSPMMQRRIESGFSPEVRAAMVSLFNGKPSAWSQFVLAGMEKIGQVDAFFTSIGTAIAYDYHYNEGLKSGMSEDAAREMALVEAEDNIGRTAQPTELIDRSLYELGMSPAERVGFMFASNQRKDTGLLISAFAQWKAGNITGAQFGQTLGVAWLATGFGSALLGAAWRDATDDDDDAWLDWEHWSPVDISRQALLGPLGGIPLVGAFYNTMQGYGPNDPFKPAKQMASGVAKLTDGDKTEPVEKTVRRAVDVVNGAAVFIPKLEGVAVGANILEQAFNLADNFVSDTEGEAAKKERAALAKERKAAKE